MSRSRSIKQQTLGLNRDLFILERNCCPSDTRLGCSVLDVAEFFAWMRIQAQHRRGGGDALPVYRAPGGRLASRRGAPPVRG